MFVIPIPAYGRWQALIKRYQRSIAKLVQLRNIRAASRSAPWEGGSWNYVDVAPDMRGHAADKLCNRNLLCGSDMVDAEVLTEGAHQHDAFGQIAHIAEAAGFFATALNRKGQRADGMVLSMARPVSWNAVTIAGMK